MTIKSLVTTFIIFNKNNYDEYNDDGDNDPDVNNAIVDYDDVDLLHKILINRPLD